MIDNELQERLTGNSAVAAIIGDKSYPMRAAQGAEMPFIRWQRISRSQITDEALDEAVAPVSARIQIDAYATTYTEARNLAEAVTAALEGWGDPLDGTVRSVRLDSERDLDESDESVRIARVSQDWLIIFDH